MTLEEADREWGLPAVQVYSPESAYRRLLNDSVEPWTLVPLGVSHDNVGVAKALSWLLEQVSVRVVPRPASMEEVGTVTE